MLPRPDAFQFATTINIILLDPKEEKNYSTDRCLEKFAFPISQLCTYGLTCMATKHSFLIMRNFKNITYGYQITIEALTEKDLSDESKKNYETIKNSVDNSLKLFDLSNMKISEINFKSTKSNNPNGKFKGKIANKKYERNEEQIVIGFEINILDESEKVISEGLPLVHLSNNRCDKIIEVHYEYKISNHPSVDHIKKLNLEVKQYIDKFTNCLPFYKSILSKDYNQALRRACSVANLDLVKMLFRYNLNGELNLDINQASLNGKTPLDYAKEANNSQLIVLLKEKGGVEASVIIQTILHKNVAFSEVIAQSAHIDNCQGFPSRFNRILLLNNNPLSSEVLKDLNIKQFNGLR